MSVELEKQEDSGKYRLLAAGLILLSAAAHILYLLFFCPLDLAPDEAHYWDWSRHLDWSYYSKGPLVAWLIRGGTELFGPLSVSLSGTEMPAVRLPAVVCGSLMLWGIYLLGEKTLNSKLAFFLTALSLTIPPVAAASSLITIDSPYTCAWVWALVFGHMALFENKSWAWPAGGVAIGIGILAKYTMILWLGGLFFYLLFSTDRKRLLQAGPWVMGITAALCASPILIWNIQNGWVSFHHVSALAGMHDGPRIHWTGPLVYLGQQFALLLGFWFVVWAWAMWRFNPWATATPKLNYLWWISAAPFFVFFVFSPKTGGGEINWPITAYLSGLVLMGGLIVELWNHALERTRLASRFLICGFALLGLTLAVVAHQTELIRPALVALAGTPNEKNPFPLRKVDPTCRLRGWQSLGKEVDRRRKEITQGRSTELVLAGGSWNVPGEIGFYCQGRPQAYSIGLVNGDRHSQYDLWKNPVDNPKDFLGKDFLVVGSLSAEARKGFAEVVDLAPFYYQEKGQPISVWHFTYCKNFRGFAVIKPGGHF
ncbi:MAG: glycosyltransferase family 39 protein [Gemmataceae bacterium]|nr:glycosyltransferase family 39 protein [Gemmataceae bacterium]